VEDEKEDEKEEGLLFLCSFYSQIISNRFPPQFDII